MRRTECLPGVAVTREGSKAKPDLHLLRLLHCGYCSSHHRFLETVEEWGGMNACMFDSVMREGGVSLEAVSHTPRHLGLTSGSQVRAGGPRSGEAGRVGWAASGAWEWGDDGLGPLSRGGLASAAIKGHGRM